jgi:Holliday junction resolvase RusA-like endonuclease
VIIISQEIKLVIDNDILQKYNSYYFKLYPKRKKQPIETPTHPSINKWMIMKRPQMNDLKQKYKDFIIWFVEDNGLTNKKIEKCEMTFVSYFKTKIRKDVDNTVPKFILDGMSEAGLIIDDDSLHLESLTLKCGYDKDNPRTEIYITVNK